MIVITGGAGFIGSCLVKKLNDYGLKDIIIVDSLGKSEKWKNLRGKQFHSFFHKNDFMENFLPITDWVESYNIDTIVHLGACSETTESDVDYLMDNNYTYSRNLCDYCHSNDIRFIYASSAATYGDGNNGYDDYMFDSLMPLNPYGFSKSAFDMYVVNNNYDKFHSVGLKFFNVFGPNEYHKKSMISMVFKAYQQIKETGKVQLFKSNNKEFGDGQQMRDFIYVKDCVNIIRKLIFMPDVKGIFNIGTGKARSWNDLANSVFAAMGKHPIIEYIDMPDNLSGQYQNFTEANMQKFNSVIKDFKFTSLEEGIADYVQNYLMKDNIYL